jgi:lipopolysaccharide transport system ATP-binding protein
MKPIIQVENLSKCYRIGARASYGSLRDEIMEVITAPFRRRGASSVEDNTIWALKDVSFEVMEGEVLGVIGRNGAGKSTLLKILSRITEPTSGRIEMRGRVASLLEVGTGFHPELTGRENILLNGALLGMRRSEIKKKFDEIVAFAEIEKFLDTPVKRYSSGMYVRLAFAVAAHLEPEILIIDEVLAVGDAGFQKKCLGKMGDVARGGRTVLFVSHNMGAVQQLCSRALLLSSGQIIKSGSPQSVVEGYLLSQNVKSASSENNIYHLNRTNAFGNRMKFKKCVVLNAKAKKTETLKFGEPFYIYLEAISKSELQSLSFVIGIDSFDGNRILTVASEDANRLFKCFSGQLAKIMAYFPDLHLIPGYYWISIAIKQHGFTIDHVFHASTFEIISAVFDGMNPYPGYKGYIWRMPVWRNIK